VLICPFKKSFLQTNLFGSSISVAFLEPPGKLDFVYVNSVNSGYAVLQSMQWRQCTIGNVSPHWGVCQRVIPAWEVYSNQKFKLF
jgi:hypothetical protein